MLHDVFGASEQDRQNSGCLEIARDQAERLMTHRTIRNKHDRFHTIRLASPKHFGAIDFDRMPLATIRGDTNEIRGQTPDPSCRLGRSEGRQRKPRIAVLHRGVFTIDRHMGNPHIMVLPDIASVDLVKLGLCVVGCTNALFTFARIKR